MSKRKVPDIINQRFGYLIVLNLSSYKNKKWYFNFKCDCGVEKIMSLHHVKSGNTISCGCYSKSNKAKITHNLSNTRLYRIYGQMIDRCYNPKHQYYKYYGGRGITICDEWLDKKNGLIKFYNWAISNGYKDNLTIDRIDNHKNYDQSNCRWVTIREQSNNTRRNVLITFNNKTQNIKQWSLELGIKYSLIYDRLRNGWSIDEALTVQSRNYNRGSNAI